MSHEARQPRRRVRRMLSTRAGGVSAPPYDSLNLGLHVGDEPEAVARNRELLCEAIGLEPAAMAWMDQVHSANVVHVERRQDDPYPATDAMVTATAGIALNVLTADCVPVLLWDDAAGVIGAAHAGRKGVELGIARATVDAMCEIGARPESVEALLGPAICGRCYEVPQQMCEQVNACAPGSASRTRRGTPALDLHAGLVGQLAEAGVARVQADDRCTAEESSLFSYRRDRTTGRQSAVIWIEEEPA